MGQSTQALRTRIKSVNSTRKITKAMEMIANAKLFRLRSMMESNRIYAGRLKETVEEIVSNNPEVESKYIKETTGDRTVSVVFTSDLGLCGGYNQNILKYCRDHLRKEDPIFLVGTSTYRLFNEEGFNLLNKEPISCDKITFQELKDIIIDGIHLYQDNEVDIVQIIYTKFVNTMSFKPDVDVLLPCKSEEFIRKPGELYVDTLFEPSATKILDELIPMMIQDVAYADWMESTTSEQGSRRVAMKTATDNADELSSELLLEYNKVRQANITQEITEIVGGSEAV